jgi:hypothetical protein
MAEKYRPETDESKRDLYTVQQDVKNNTEPSLEDLRYNNSKKEGVFMYSCGLGMGIMITTLLIVMTILSFTQFSFGGDETTAIVVKVMLIIFTLGSGFLTFKVGMFLRDAVKNKL